MTVMTSAKVTNDDEPQTDFSVSICFKIKYEIKHFLCAIFENSVTLTCDVIFRGLNDWIHYP